MLYDKRYKIVNTVIQIIKNMPEKRRKKKRNIIHRGKKMVEINQNKIFFFVSFQMVDKWPFILYSLR